VASNGAGGRVLVLLRTTPLRGTFTLKNALESGHFSPFSVGPLLQQHKHPAAHSLFFAKVETHQSISSVPLTGSDRFHVCDGQAMTSVPKCSRPMNLH